MRITKRQLRRIIREEKAKVLAETRVRKAVRILLEGKTKIFIVRDKGKYYFAEIHYGLSGYGGKREYYVRDSIEEIMEIMKALGHELVSEDNNKTLVEPGAPTAKKGDFVSVDSSYAETDPFLVQLIGKFKLSTAGSKPSAQGGKNEDQMFKQVFDLVLMGVLDSYEAEEMEMRDPGSWEYQIERIRDELTDLDPEYDTVKAAIKAAKTKARTDYRRGEQENPEALGDFIDGVLRY